MCCTELVVGGRFLAILLPRGVEDYRVSALPVDAESACTWSQSCSLRDGQTKCAEDFDRDRDHPLQPARRSRHHAHVVSIQHPPNSTPHTFECRFRSGPTLNGCCCCCRGARSASMFASSLNITIFSSQIECLLLMTVLLYHTVIGVLIGVL